MMARLPAALIASIAAVFLAAESSSAEEGGSSYEFLKEEMVYSAAKHKQHAKDAPASAYVITSLEIERYGYRTLGEAL